MIEPTEKDIGRSVIYTAPHGKQETGTIKSFNEDYVFVRYGLGDTAAATRKKDLSWP